MQQIERSVFLRPLLPGLRLTERSQRVTWSSGESGKRQPAIHRRLCVLQCPVDVLPSERIEHLYEMSFGVFVVRLFKFVIGFVKLTGGHKLSRIPLRIVLSQCRRSCELQNDRQRLKKNAKSHGRFSWAGNGRPV